MPQPPLRCHLLIGPPASGKTTLARDLAPLLEGDSGEPALVLSTDAIRAELFGDASVQGPSREGAVFRLHVVAYNLIRLANLLSPRLVPA